ncbi:hypothetical protein BDR04DRAFT_1137768 [Suillus decipiens]|nr:hypothetical protein BDR04DRAFT_1137768 [Suillus decipiens]
MAYPLSHFWLLILAPTLGLNQQALKHTCFQKSPVLLDHPLQEIWETKVGPTMIEYLCSKGVEWTSLDPVRMGYADDSSPPIIIWMGVVPGSLSAQHGIEVATCCKSILSAHDIEEVHIEIRESEVIHSAGPKMYKPFFHDEPTTSAREPFSTALGLPICAEVTPSIQGTGGFFISDPAHPGKIYLITTRHYHNFSQPHRNVLLLGNTGIKKHIKVIEKEIRGKHVIIDHLKDRLEHAKEMDAEVMQKDAKLLEEAEEAVGALKTFLTDVSRDWKEPKNHVLGHVVLSPPISASVGEEGFREDWAVIEIDNYKINSTNFVGNAIDLGITIPFQTLTSWMRNHSPNPSSLEYPWNRLLEFHDTISDEEMWKPSQKTVNHNNDPYIMVIKRVYASGLAVGRLNTIRSFTRIYFEGQLGQMSKEVAIFPRNYKSGAFSEPGDSGSAVVDGKGRFAGSLTCGAGVADAFDCTYITSINFLVKRMLEYGLEADLFPSLSA